MPIAHCHCVGLSLTSIRPGVIGRHVHLQNSSKECRSRGRRSFWTTDTVCTRCIRDRLLSTFRKISSSLIMTVLARSPFRRPVRLYAPVVAHMTRYSVCAINHDAPPRRRCVAAPCLEWARRCPKHPSTPDTPDSAGMLGRHAQCANTGLRFDRPPCRAPTQYTLRTR
jgi:hypothetical protein